MKQISEVFKKIYLLSMHAHKLGEGQRQRDGQKEKISSRFPVELGAQYGIHDPEIMT